MVKPVMGQQEVVVKATCVNRTGGFFGVVKRGEVWYTTQNVTGPQCHGDSLRRCQCWRPWR